jgi:DNA-binding NarL/FixJ family response regulator
MPTMPGDEATRQIKALLPQTRVVALSMFEEPGVAQRMRDAGLTHMMLHPAPVDLRHLHLIASEIAPNL